MIYNYLKIIIRNFISDGMYSFIIVFGLAIGIAASLIIAQYVHFELSFDKDYKDDKGEIYYAYMKQKSSIGIVDQQCHPAVAPLLMRSIPEVESSVRMAPFKWEQGEDFILRREENGKALFYSKVDHAYQVDPEIFDFFDIPLVEGDHKTALPDHNSVVITRRLAEKFFKDEPALNKILKYSWYGRPFDVKVTGVTENPLPNSSLQYDAFILMWGREEQENVWWSPLFQTFVKLHPGADQELVTKKINEAAAVPLSDVKRESNMTESIHLYPFKDFHFYKPYNSNGTALIKFTGDHRIISFFIAIGIIILLISWVNYINLTTARALHRAKEVGLRKVNGASRKNIIFQFLMEFFLLNAISLLLALTMTQLFFGTFAKSLGSNAEWIVWREPMFWALISVFLTFSTLVSGLYPAFVMSNYNPAKVLKGSYGRSQRGIRIRRGLVLAQVGLSVFLLMSIYVIVHQLNYMQNKDLGMSAEQVLVVTLDELDTVFTRRQAFERWKIEMMSHRGVQAVAAVNVYPGQTNMGHLFFRVSDPERKQFLINTNCILGDYLETLNVQLLNGTTFQDYPNDSTKVLINEHVAQVLGFDPPVSAAGQPIVMRRDKDLNFEVIGVIKDFSTSTKEPVQGLVLHNYGVNQVSQINCFIMKLSTQNLASTMDEIKREWSDLFNDAPFDYFFLDTYFDTFYKEERQFASVFGFFSIIGVAITCMGLFGLSLFDTGSRTKEVGIRKSLGGSPSGIIWLFSKEYLKLICIASIISVPIGAWILDDWLKNYPQRIQFGADIFVVPLVLMILIALFTIGYQTFKAAHMNPVNSLRAE